MNTKQWFIYIRETVCSFFFTFPFIGVALLFQCLLLLPLFLRQPSYKVDDPAFFHAVAFVWGAVALLWNFFILRKCFNQLLLFIPFHHHSLLVRFLPFIEFKRIEDPRLFDDQILGPALCHFARISHSRAVNSLIRVRWWIRPTKNRQAFTRHSEEHGSMLIKIISYPISVLLPLCKVLSMPPKVC